MCGITGFYSINKLNKENSLKTIDKMTNTIKHRGPDRNGFFQIMKTICI